MCLFFYVRGLATELKFCAAYFANTGVTSYQIMSLFWNVVSLLEICCSVEVVAAFLMEPHLTESFTECTEAFREMQLMTQLFTKQSTSLGLIMIFFFFSDVPHLIKTCTNCLFNSGRGRFSRYMWNNGKYLLWQHIVDVYKHDLDNGLHMLQKLSADHILLNSYSVMRVKLAVQVLSDSVAVALRQVMADEASETSKLCEMMNKFFDCLNVRSLTEYKTRNKPDVKPYTDVNDERLDWLQTDFLSLSNLSTWKNNI